MGRLLFALPTWAVGRRARDRWSAAALTLTSTVRDTQLISCTMPGLGQTQVVCAACAGFIPVAVTNHTDESNREEKGFIFLQFQVAGLYQKDVKAGT